MGMLDQDCANWEYEIGQYVVHSHIDTHVSSSISSALEVDDILLEKVDQDVSDVMAHDESFFIHHGAALRLGVISTSST